MSPSSQYATTLDVEPPGHEACTRRAIATEAGKLKISVNKYAISGMNPVNNNDENLSESVKNLAGYQCEFDCV